MRALLSVQREGAGQARVNLRVSLCCPHPRGWVVQTAATAELAPLRRKLAEYLSEGVLTDQYVLRHMDDVMAVLRNCNVALQWTLLHSTTRNRKLLDAMHNHAPAADDVLGMLLDVADVEFRLREVRTRRRVA